MRLKKILLRYYPPGLALKFELHDGETCTRSLDLPEFSEKTDVATLATHLASTGLGPGYEGSSVERLKIALARLQHRLLAEHKERIFELERTLRGHLLPLTNMAFAPRSHKCATGSYDRTCRIWSTETGEELACLQGHRSVVYAIAFSFPLGERVATGSFDRTVRLWNCDTAEPLLEITAHSAEVTCVCFSPLSTSHMIASAGMDHTSRLINASTGQELATFRTHTQPISSLQFSVDGRKLITASLDTNLCVWDVTRGNTDPICILKGHTGAVSACSLDHSGQLLASASLDGTALLWDLRKASTPLAILSSQDQTEILDVAMDYSARWIATAGVDGTTKIWDIHRNDNSSLHLLKELKGHRGAVNKVCFSPGGVLLLSAGADATARIWHWQNEEVTHPQVLSGHKCDVFSAAFAPCPEPERAITIDTGNTVCIWRSCPLQEPNTHY